MMQDLPLPGCRYCLKRPVAEGYSFCLACLRAARIHRDRRIIWTT